MKILLPLSWIYGGIMAFRNWMFNHGYLKEAVFPLPIISIGNLAVGGTGKTPHTEYLLRLLTTEGFHCAMLSRGYGRKTTGYYEAKGNNPQDVGDEPWQVQQKFPQVNVCVCEKRVIGIQKLLKGHQDTSVILLDDAYQHRYVKPGLSILLTDYSRPYYADDVIPAGRLREFKSGAKRAHVIIVTKCPETISPETQEKIRKSLSPLPHQEVFFTKFVYGECYPFEKQDDRHLESAQLKVEKVLLLCGIARPKNLTEYLRPRCNTLTVKAFPDHHNFTAGEIEDLAREAQNYQRVITTEKDAARLSGYPLPQSLRQRLWVQPIEVKFINQDIIKFNKIIKDYVTENQRNR